MTMTIRSANRCRMYPNKTQITSALKTLGSCRYVYNLYLDTWNTCYKYTGTGLSYNECCKSLTDLKKAVLWLKEADSTALQSSLRYLSDAFQAYFDGISDHPVFHRKGKKDSYTCKNNNDSIRILDQKHIQLPKLGRVKVHGLRKMNGKILSAAMTLEPDGKWYVSLQYESEEDRTLPQTGNTVGIDLGLHDFAVLSDGEKIPNPKNLKKLENKLEKEQRILSRREKANISRYIEKNGKRFPVYKRPLHECKNYMKQKRKVASIHAKIRNCRRDFEHKLSAEIIKNHDVICLEDLNIKGMMKNHRLAKAVGDASFSEFSHMLAYKGEWYGREVIHIGRYYPSSQICSVCGTVVPVTKDLCIRKWECPHCGSHHDRDINAAKNIEKEGMSLLLLNT